MNESQFNDDLSDDQLEEIFQQLAGFSPTSSVDDDIAKVQDVIAMIDRVRTAGFADTARMIDTKVEAFVASRFQSTGTSDDFPDNLGRFTIKGQLGKGGFGLVLLAHDPNLNRDIALKIPRPEAVLRPELKQRFIREGRAAASLAHPNIVPVYESGQVGSVCFLASQFVPGQTLAEYSLIHPDQFTPKVAAEVVKQLAEAMGHAHQRGVLHRDLKPSNILIEEATDDQSNLADRVRITDFGLAKMELDQSETQTGALVGTPAYMSPEQTDNKNPSGPPTDIYSLGAILYQLLTGQPPFQAESIVDTIAAVRNQEPKSIRSINGAVPKDLEAVCLKCLEKNPSSRYTDAFALAKDFSRFLDEEPVLARPVTSLDRLSRWVQRNPIVAGALTSAALFLVVALAGTAFGLVRSNQALKREQAALVVESDALKNEKIASADAREKYTALKNAIDTYYVSVSENQSLKNMPGSGELRRELLQLAVNYYDQYVLHQSDDPDRFFEIAETERKLAKLLNEIGEAESALPHAKNGLALIEQVTGIDENKVLVLKAELIYQQYDALRGTGEAKDALPLLDDAISILEKAVKATDASETKLKLAKMYANLGNELRAQQKFDEARKKILAAEVLYRFLATTETKPGLEVYTGLVSSRGSLAVIEKQSGKLPEAKKIQEELFNELTSLVEAEPDNWELVEVYVVTALNLTGTCFEMNESNEAIKFMDQVSHHSERLNSLFPLHDKYRRLRSGLLAGHMVAGQRLNDTKMQLEYAERSVEFARDHVKLQPNLMDAQANLAQQLSNLLASYFMTGTDHPDAVKLANEALDVSNSVLAAEPNSLDVGMVNLAAHRNLAEIYVRKGEDQAAFQLLEVAEKRCDKFLESHANNRKVRDNAHAIYSTKASVEYRLDQLQLALDHWQKAIDQKVPWKQKDDLKIRIGMACANLRLQKTEPARELVESIDLERLSSGGMVLMASYFALLDEQDEELDHSIAALEWLQKAADKNHFKNQTRIDKVHQMKDLSPILELPQAKAIFATAKSRFGS